MDGAEEVARSPDGIRESVASHILCEFSIRNRSIAPELVQALIYDFLYRSSRKLARNKVATFVISARTPREEVLQDFGYVATDLPGFMAHTKAFSTYHAAGFEQTEQRTAQCLV